MTYILLRNTHPFWSGCRVEGSWRQACFHTHVTKFVRLIVFDNTSEQGGSDVGLIPFVCCKGFEVGFLGAYVRSNIYHNVLCSHSPFLAVHTLHKRRTPGWTSHDLEQLDAYLGQQMLPGIFFILCRGRCFPLPKNGAVKSQPVKAWNPRSASNRDGFDSSMTICEMLM